MKNSKTFSFLFSLFSSLLLLSLVPTPNEDIEATKWMASSCWIRECRCDSIASSSDNKPISSTLFRAFGNVNRAIKLSQSRDRIWGLLLRRSSSSALWIKLFALLFWIMLLSPSVNCRSAILNMPHEPPSTHASRQVNGHSTAFPPTTTRTQIAIWPSVCDRMRFVLFERPTRKHRRISEMLADDLANVSPTSHSGVMRSTLSWRRSSLRPHSWRMSKETHKRHYRISRRRCISPRSACTIARIARASTWCTITWRSRCSSRSITFARARRSSTIVFRRLTSNCPTCVRPSLH